MRKLEHEEMRLSVGGRPQAAAAQENRVQRLGRWLVRAIGRSCQGGMWTLSPDGKLRCEALRDETL
jgi:hypothetical protein